jgi:hypothetical protein
MLLRGKTISSYPSARVSPHEQTQSCHLRLIEKTPRHGNSLGNQE